MCATDQCVTSVWRTGITCVSPTVSQVCRELESDVRQAGVRFERRATLHLITSVYKLNLNYPPKAKPRLRLRSYLQTPHDEPDLSTSAAPALITALLRL